jgi:hypothetical protein
MDYKLSGFICCLFVLTLNPVSFVYNLKLAETTRRQASALTNQYRRPSIGAVTFIDQERKKYSGVHQRIDGTLWTLLCASKGVYIRADFAFAHVHDQGILSTSCSKSLQTDDILFTGGISRKIGKKIKMTLSGLFGIPTQKTITDLTSLQFGTFHLGIGGQLDGAFRYSKSGRHVIMAAGRFIHFIPRLFEVCLRGHSRHFEFGIGNLVDVFIAHNSSWIKHAFEFGYNATFDFNACITPSAPDVIDDTTFIRSSIFATYQYRFLIRHVPSAVVFGVSYGRDHRSKIFGLQRIITAWATWGVNF